MKRGCSWAILAVSLLVGLGFFCVVCGRNLQQASSGEHYWDTGCVTGDEKLMLLGGDESAAVELTGGTLAARNDLYGEAVVCGQSGGVAYGSSESMVRLPSNEKVATDEESTTDLVAARPDGTLVHFNRRNDSKGRAREFAQLRAGKAGQPGKSFELAPVVFSGVGEQKQGGPSGFFTWTGGVLGDGRLLLGAGWRPNRTPDELEAAPWGFFGMDLDSGAVTPLGPAHETTRELDGSMLWKVAASPDGAVRVASFRGESSIAVAIYRAGRTPDAVAAIDGAREAVAMDVSASGDRIAVAALAPDGSSTRVMLLDGAGKTVWKSEPLEGSVYFLKLLGDGSLVYMTSRRAAARVAADGSPKWKSQL